eukprot:UN1662
MSMLVRVQQMCDEGWGVSKVYLHLDEMSAWSKDAANEVEFNAADMSVTHQDVGDARIFRVQVIRPEAGPRSARTTSGSQVFCQVLGLVVLLLIFFGSLAGTLGFAFFPDTARPALRDATKPYLRLSGVPSDLAVKAFGAASAVAFLLLLLLCRAADCLGCGRFCCGGLTSSSARVSYRSFGGRPLLCNYTLLGPDHGQV